MDFKEEERKKVNADTKQKMKEGTEESSLVVEGGEVFGFVDLINNMENSVIAVRLKTLFENGISESMIESKYQELSSGVTNMQTALDNMRTVCDMLLKYLSDIPNGIIINMTTGEVDVKKSLESAVECGILRPDDILIVDPFKEKFELAPKETFVETIMNSKIFSTEEKNDFLSDYNKFLRTNYSFGSISHSKSRKEDEKLDKEAEDFLTIEIGETKEEQKRQNEKRDYYKMDTVEDMSFMQMVVFFAKKDTIPDMKFVNKKLKNYENSKFYQRVIGEDGKVDFDKLQEFEKEWLKEFEETNLRDELKRYNVFFERENINFNVLDDANKANLRAVLARGYFSKNERNKDMLEKLCKKIGIKPNEEEILKFVGVNTVDELEEFASDHSINEENYMQQISEMKKFKKMSQSDKMVFERLDKLRLDINPNNVETIAKLYVMYSEKSKMYDERSFDSKMCLELANSIEKYMYYNKEYFSEYMTILNESGRKIKNKINYANVKRVLGHKEANALSDKGANGFEKVFDAKIVELKGEDGKITQQEFDQFFEEQSEELAISYNEEKKARQEKKDEIKAKYAQDNNSNGESNNQKDKKPNKFMTFIGNVAKRVTSLFKKNTVPLLEKGKDNTEEKKDLKDSKDSEKTNTEMKDNKNKLDYIKVDKTPTIQMPQTTEIEGEDKEKPIDVGR